MNDKSGEEVRGFVVDLDFDEDDDDDKNKDEDEDDLEVYNQDDEDEEDDSDLQHYQIDDDDDNDSHSYFDDEEEEEEEGTERNPWMELLRACSHGDNLSAKSLLTNHPDISINLLYESDDSSTTALIEGFSISPSSLFPPSIY